MGKEKGTTYAPTLKLVCVAAQIVASVMSTMKYPDIRWYLYTFFAFSSPPNSAGM